MRRSIGTPRSGADITELLHPFSSRVCLVETPNSCFKEYLIEHQKEAMGLKWSRSVFK
jgi:hypothetical protein